MATTSKSKSQDLLVSVAESIGSTLGAIAAKADAAQEGDRRRNRYSGKEVNARANEADAEGKNTAEKARRSKPARKARASAARRGDCKKVVRKAVRKGARSGS